MNPLIKNFKNLPPEGWQEADHTTETLTMTFTKDYRTLNKEVTVSYTSQKQRALNIIKSRYVLQAYIDKTPLGEIVSAGKFNIVNV